MNMGKIFHISLIIFLTALLCACFMYDERVYDNPYDPDTTDGVRLETRTMQIDGDTSDWDDVQVIREDNTEELTEDGMVFPAGSDLHEIKMVQDNENIYFCYSTIDGSPLMTPSIELHSSFRGDGYNIQFNIAHNFNPPASNLETQGIYNTWGYYDNWSDEENYINFGIPNPPIRFAGVDPNSNNIEYAISKYLYWEYAIDNELLFGVGTQYSYYSDLYGNGGCDGIEEVNDLYILAKDPNASPPSTDIPLIQFDRPSGSITTDGSNADMDIWSETGAWYQDFTGDDLNTGEDNTDIDRVYIKQDDSIIYFLLTFADPGPFTNVYDIYIDVSIEDQPTLTHTFQAQYTGAIWQNEQVNYDVSTDNTDCLAVSTDGYLELQFGKYLTWPDLPIAAMRFDIRTVDSGALDADHAQFTGTYKSSTDPTP